jgi:hypothetical protein
MDADPPESIAEETRRLQREWHAPSPSAPVEHQIDAGPVSAQSYWTPPEPEPPPTGRRIGWLLVVIAGHSLDACGATVLREKTAGVPPRGFGDPPAVF